MRKRMEPLYNEATWQGIVEQWGVVEFDWYAQDRLGQVAAFSSFGRGAIPQAVKSCRQSYNELFHVIEVLPEVTEAVLEFAGDGVYDDWLHYSRQGLFGYDFQDAHRTSPLEQYDLMTRPMTPIHMDSLCLSPRLRKIVPEIDIEFGQESKIPMCSIPH